MHWELLRDEQTKALETPNTRMVITNDVGEYNDLHPLNKKAVGERLAGEALSLAYGMDIVSTGPTLISVEKSENQFILNFETEGSKLTLKHGDVVCGLSAWINKVEIAVEGMISGTTVVIETPHANKVTAISYAWIDDPANANLYNAEGLPAVPFKKEQIA
jgi:sialate O-acetylesterase